MTEFSDAVDEALAGDTRVVIVQSASPKFFSAGADIKRFTEGDVEANMEMIRVSQAAFRRMAGAKQVFIAYLAGHALGGGLEIALACDIRLADAGRYKLGHARGDAGAAARQRRHAAADPAGRTVARARAARHWAHVQRRRRAARWG